MYRNYEGYSDPTSGAAMRHYYNREKGNSDRKKAQRKKNHQERVNRAQKYKGKPKVYICSPYAGDMSHNRAVAIRACRYVITQGMIPVASHLLYPQILNEGNPDERELGLVFGLELLSACDQVWVFGERISSGMEQEIREAQKLDKKIRYLKEVPV